MPPATGKFRPFPRVKDWVKPPGRAGCAATRPIDAAILKQLYLDGPDYDWPGFCARHRFNSKFTLNGIERQCGFIFRDWKRDWIKHNAGLQDEDIAPQVLDLRKMVASRRIDFVKDWVNRSQYLKTLLDATLSAHGSALKHDQHHAAMIAKGEIEAKFKLDAKDLGEYGRAALMIQELETKALMIVTEKSTSIVMPAIGSTDGTDSSDGHDERPDFNITTIGQTGITASESTRLLAEWFDQKPEPIVVPSKPEEDEDLPDAGD